MPKYNLDLDIYNHTNMCSYDDIRYFETMPPDNTLFPSIDVFSIIFIYGVVFNIITSNYVSLFFQILLATTIELIFIIFLWILSYYLVFKKIPIIKSILETK
jgi:hypothetical protein